MNNPEHTQNQTDREPQEIKRSLVDSIKDFFRDVDPDKETHAKDYLEKRPEEVVSQPALTDAQKLKHQAQRSRLESLKESLNVTAAAINPEAPQMVAQQARSAASELSEKTNYTFQAGFYQRMASTQIDDNFVLPYARYIAESSDKITTSDKLTSAKQKAELALEIFIGETGNASGADKTLKKVLANIVASHDDKSGAIKKYLESEEFKDLAQKYGLNSEQTKELLKAPTGPEPSENGDGRPSLMSAKNAILQSVAEDELRIRLDLELLSLSPDRILALLRTVPKDKITEYRSKDSAMLEELSSPAATEDFRKDAGIAKWLNDFFSNVNLDPATRKTMEDQVRGYFLQMRNELYLSKVKRFPHNAYMGENPYQMWVNKFQDDIIAADLMTGANDPFLYVEYFKGKIAEVIRNPDHNRVDEVVANFKKGDRFDIDEHHIYGEIMRDLRQAWLSQMAQEKDENFQRAASNITTSITKMKQEPLSKRNTAFGDIYDESGKQTKRGAEIMFKYRFKSEEIELGGQYTQQRALYEPTIAHLTGVFPKAMSEFGNAYKTLSDFASMAETGGDPEKLASAAKAITNNLVDVVAEQAPIVIQSMQSYLRLFREKLSANGNVLAPDFFASTPYIKDELMKLLELEIKNAHPDITDFEREIYLKMGKGLAIASGEFLSVLANALPPMTHSIDKLPPEVINKIKNNETLTLEEMKTLEGNFGPEFKDFPFRGLLMNMNPLRWLYTWIKFNDYGVFNLGFNPYRPGENARDPHEAWELTQKIMFSSFLGLEDDVVQYFDGKHVMPFFELSNMNQKISLEKRGGVRARVKQLLEGDYVVKSPDAKTGLRYIDGDATFRKMIHKSPMLAYYFMNDPGSHGGIEVRWSKSPEGKSSVPNGDLRNKLIGELMDYMHEYYPTFFTSLEQPHFFRRKELSFGQKIRENIHQDLTQHPEHDAGYWLFLSQDERRENITDKADPSPLGTKYMHENLIATRRVSERMNVVMQELQTYIQVKSPFDAQGKRKLSMRDFLTSSDMLSYNEGMYKTLENAIKNISNLYGLSPGDKDKMIKQFQQYTREVYYGNGNSIFESGQYIGNDMGGNKRTLPEYYIKLMNDGLLTNPFDWAYFDQTELTYQSTGTNMTGRNMDDFGKILAYTSKYHTFVTALQDGITKPEKSKDTIKAAIDKIEGSINGISTSYDAKDAAKAGWMAEAFLTYPFIASRWKDIPITGKLPFIHSWATMVNKDDYRGLNAWNGQTRKEILDHTLGKEWSKAILDPAQENKLFEGFETKLMKINHPFKKGPDGKPIEIASIPIPKFLQKTLGRKFKKRFEDGAGDFSVKSFKKFLKTESWWLGGKENFGLGYNVLLSVFVIGFLMMMFQAIKEGMKSAEVK